MKKFIQRGETRTPAAPCAVSSGCGALTYWDNINKRVTKTATSNKLTGVAVREAADGDASGRARSKVSALRFAEQFYQLTVFRGGRAII